MGALSLLSPARLIGKSPTIALNWPTCQHVRLTAPTRGLHNQAIVGVKAFEPNALTRLIDGLYGCKRTLLIHCRASRMHHPLPHQT